MEMNDAMRETILLKRATADLRKLALGARMMSLKDDGLEKVLAGVTTAQELARVTELHLD